MMLMQHSNIVFGKPLLMTGLAISRSKLTMSSYKFEFKLKLVFNQTNV